MNHSFLTFPLLGVNLFFFWDLSNGPGVGAVERSNKVELGAIFCERPWRRLFGGAHGISSSLFAYAYSLDTSSCAFVLFSYTRTRTYHTISLLAFVLFSQSKFYPSPCTSQC